MTKPTYASLAKLTVMMFGRPNIIEVMHNIFKVYRPGITAEETAIMVAKINFDYTDAWNIVDCDKARAYFKYHFFKPAEMPIK